MRGRSRSLRVAMGTLAALAACTSGKLNATSTIEIDPTSTSVEVDPAQAMDYVVTIRNTGQGKALTISSIRLDYSPATDAETQGAPAFSVEAPGLPAIVSPTGENLGAESYEFHVIFAPQDDSTPRTARVTIHNDNATDASLQALAIEFTTRVCQPALGVPANVDFALVTLDAGSKAEPVQLTNTGSCPLVIDWLSLSGSPAFVVDLGDGRTAKASDAGTELQLSPPVTIPANSGLAWTSTFTPTDAQPAQAVLTVHSNETGVLDGKRQIQLVGNSTGPRVVVTPLTIEFGGKKIGKAAGVEVTIQSIGTQALVVTGLSIKTPGSSPDFSIDYSELPGGNAPTSAAPVTVDVNQSVKFLAKYTPSVMNPTDSTGKVIQDAGTIVIQTNAADPTLEVSMSGYGLEVACPQPVILIEEGETAQPLDTLHLHGEQSQAASGSIQSYAWTVAQPNGNKFALVPDSKFASPTHEVNISGSYTYCLDVCDDDRCSSDTQCKTTACKTVSVVSENAIHCELTWDTPSDTDPYDSGPNAGSDMDLHFAHPFATGPDLDGDGKPDGWFDIPYDVFWYNRNPEWESPDPNVPDNPTLDRDDTDGWGPENVTLRQPVNGRVYRVGVHYWDDHGFGASYPRLQCFISGELVFDRDLRALQQSMVMCDMWYAATISWPQGIVTPVERADHTLMITHNYMNPAFEGAGGSPCGQK